MLSHVELLTPRLEESVAFARDVLGLFVVHEEDDSVYLRCWGDYYAYSLVFTAAAEPGLGHGAWRSWSEEQLQIAVESVRATGVEGHWIDPSYGHGAAFRFTGPAGHQTELFWEVEPAVAPAGEESPYPERPQRSGTHGMRLRMLDHLTVTAPDTRAAADWHRDVLDFRLMAAVQGAPGGPCFFCTATTNEKSHDYGFILDGDGKLGRLHHLAFWVETNHDLTEGAKLLIEHGYELDYGPGQHGIGEQNFLYFRDPAGLRYELNSGGYRNYVPDWEPVIWGFEDGPNNSFRTEVGMPAVHMVAIPPGQVGRREGMLEGTVAKA